MLTILSPSKTLNLTPAPSNLPYTMPQLLSHSEELMRELKKLSSQEISEMMKVSEKISQLNYQRYQDWHTPFTVKNSKQAILTFAGDVYRNIDTDNYSSEDFQFAQKNICTLSGLYGLLRPLDLMQPYRLEMKFRNKYWKARLTKATNNSLKEGGHKHLINLASKEYSKPLNFKEITATIISPEFRVKKDDKYRIIPIYAKIARGTMTNWIVKNRISTPDALKNFAEDGWKYSPKLSTEDIPVFTR